MDIVLLISLWWVIPIFLAAFFWKWTLRLFAGMVMIPDDAMGIVSKKFNLFAKNKNLPDGAIIALKGEAGIQAKTLGPGLHWGYWIWQYGIEIAPFLQISQGSIGVVEALDGKPLSGGRILGKEVACDSFQDAEAFLQNGGERGPQLNIIPPGTYRINRSLFKVEERDAVTIGDNKVGIVTTKEGTPLKTGEIAGSEVPGHNSFQNPQTFINNGGSKGLQEQVLLAGQYFINPRFASIEQLELTEVPIAHVGVVVAYVGKEGKDVSGEQFKHGNIVSKGEKGVWNEVLDPGRYAINRYTHKVINVPTANVVLNWANAKTEAHNLDKNLSTITVRSQDGFTFNLDVSQIIHIPRAEAPKVIARFGSMEDLVTQVLEPTIGNYFRNAAQNSDVIDFLRKRSERQDEAKKAIKSVLDGYNVVAVDTLIGDITPPDELMKTLTDRKIAEQEKITYETQSVAQEKRQQLEQTTALANTQKDVVAAERKVSIEEFNAKAAVKKAEGEAQSKTINAEADAKVTSVNGAAEAGKIKAVGGAEAEVMKLKVASIEADNYAGIQIADSLSKAGVDLVPKILVGSGDGKGNMNNGVFNAFMGQLMYDKLKGGEACTEKKTVAAENKTEVKPSVPVVENAANKEMPKTDAVKSNAETPLGQKNKGRSNCPDKKQDS